MLASLTSKFKFNKEESLELLKGLIKPQTEYKTIYIDKKTTTINLNKSEKIDIILSPAYYWVREEKLPVKYEFQAKNLLPSIFDGILSDGNYSYSTYKKRSDYAKSNDLQNSSWLVYAYDDTIISNKLDSLGINDSSIHSIYFAQSELESINSPIQIDEQEALVKHDNILITMPLSLTNDAKDIKEVVSLNRRTAHSININRYRNLPISEKSINIIAVTLIAFIGLFLTEFIMNKNSLKELYIESAKITKTYRLPTTSFELNSMKKGLKKLASKQEELRAKTQFILNAPLIKNEHLSLLELKNSKFIVKVNLAEAKRAEAIKNYWQKEVSIKSIKVKDNTLSAKISL